MIRPFDKPGCRVCGQPTIGNSPDCPYCEYQSELHRPILVELAPVWGDPSHSSLSGYRIKSSLMNRKGNT